MFAVEEGCGDCGDEELGTVSVGAGVLDFCVSVVVFGGGGMREVRGDGKDEGWRRGKWRRGNTTNVQP